jgi:hypothetical protein
MAEAVTVVVAARLSYLLSCYVFIHFVFLTIKPITNQRISSPNTLSSMKLIKETRITFEGRRELKTHTEFWSQIPKR